MTPDQSQIIHQVIADVLCKPIEHIQPEATLDSLDCDSLDCLEIFMRVEGELDIDIDDSDLMQSPEMTVEQFVAGIGKFLPEGAA